MAGIKKRVTDDGDKRFVACYRDPEGRQRSAGTYSSRRAAERAANREEAKVREGPATRSGPRRGSGRLPVLVFSNQSPPDLTRATVCPSGASWDSAYSFLAAVTSSPNASCWLGAGRPRPEEARSSEVNMSRERVTGVPVQDPPACGPTRGRRPLMRLSGADLGGRTSRRARVRCDAGAPARAAPGCLCRIGLEHLARPRPGVSADRIDHGGAAAAAPPYVVASRSSARGRPRPTP
jgi:hypothetical protein